MLSIADAYFVSAMEMMEMPINHKIRLPMRMEQMAVPVPN